MKTSLVLALLLCTACNLLVNKDEVILDHTPRTAVAAVDVYKDTLPVQTFKPIAEFTWSGPRSDELRAQRYFMQRAAALGASAILFGIADSDRERSSTAVGGGNGFVSGSSTHTQYLFKAKAIVYEH